MACETLIAITGTTACPPPVPGIAQDKTWITNLGNITLTGVTNKLATGFTMAATKVLYRVKSHSKGDSLREEFAKDENGVGSWKPQAKFRFLDDSPTIANGVEKLNGNDIVLIQYTKSGKFRVAGIAGGLQLVNNVSGTDAGELGELITLEGENEAKMMHLLDTDVATTLAALIAAETP